MRKILSLAICVGMMLGFVACGAGGDSYMGNWKVEKKLENAPLGDYADTDLPKIMASKFSFTKESASCFGDAMSTLGTTVKKPEYMSMEMPKEDFERMTDTTFAQLGVKGGKITRISVVKDEDRNTGIVFYVVNKDTLLTNSVGTFFILTRIK